MNRAASGHGVEQIGEADPAEQFRTNAIRDAVDDLGAILGRVDMRPWPARIAAIDSSPSGSRNYAARFVGFLRM